MVMSFVLALAFNVSHFLLSHGLLLDDLRELRLELRWYDSVLVVEVLQALHDLFGESFLSEVGVLLVLTVGAVGVAISLEHFSTLTTVHFFGLPRIVDVCALPILTVISISAESLSLLRHMNLGLIHDVFRLPVILSLIVDFELETDCSKLL